MEREELKKLITEAIHEAGGCRHKCFLDDEGKQLVLDGVNGGKLLKKAIIIGIVISILLGLGLKWLKPFVGK